MTCKDCIHSGLCYKENDYENFPDRCGSFIPERPQGEWIIDGHHIRCSRCNEYICNTDREGNKIPDNFCPNCGSDMRGKTYEND